MVAGASTDSGDFTDGGKGQGAGNAAFAQKQAVYAQSQYRTSRGLGGFTVWSEETISKRQAGMARVAQAVRALSS